MMAQSTRAVSVAPPPLPPAAAVHPRWQAANRRGRSGPQDQGDDQPGGGGTETPPSGDDPVVHAPINPTGSPGSAGAIDETALARAIGRQIERQRHQAGISQDMLAARLGYARTTVCRWERGHRVPSLVALLRVATAIGVDLTALLPRFEEAE